MDDTNLYSILIAAVFGFSALNILALLTKSADARRRRLNLGETLAIMIVLLSVGFLGMEMLHLYHIFPIKLQP